MATSEAAPGTTDGGPSATSTTSETTAGLHALRIDNFFSGTQDIGFGKSVKSSTFRVGGHGLYIECYPCGVDEDSDGWVSLHLRRPEEEDDRGSSLSLDCAFALLESLEVDVFHEAVGHPDRRPWRWAIQREELESLLMDDCFHVRCTVCIDKFPQPDPAAAAAAAAAVTHTHVVTIEEYSKTREVLAVGDSIQSCPFRVGGRCWWIDLHPCGETEDDAGGVTTYLCLEDAAADDQVEVRFEMTLLTHAGHVIWSTQDVGTFTKRTNAYGRHFPGGTMEHQYSSSSPLLQDSIQIRCDMTIVEGITAMPDPGRATGGGDEQLHGSLRQVRVRGDVTFEVGGQLFPAHKCVLATRCTAFMAQFFGPSSAKENADVVTDQPVRVDDMEPRVFEALLHFIYTDALPEVREEDKVVMAQGLLVAADRFAMERLKLICADLLCTYMNDASTAIDTLELAVKHGCHRLREACKKFLVDNFAKVAP